MHLWLAKHFPSKLAMKSYRKKSQFSLKLNFLFIPTYIWFVLCLPPERTMRINSCWKNALKYWFEECSLRISAVIICKQKRQLRNSTSLISEYISPPHPDTQADVYTLWNMDLEHLWNLENPLDHSYSTLNRVHVCNHMCIILMQFRSLVSDKNKEHVNALTFCL